MITEAIATSQTLIPVATGKAANGNPFEITLSAYAVGREDAEAGACFCPEDLYIKWQDMYEYAVGFLAIRRDCAAANSFAEEFESVQYEMAHGYEPAYKPVMIDFEIPF